MTVSIIAAAREMFSEFEKKRQFDDLEGEELQFWLKFARRVLHTADCARFVCTNNHTTTSRAFVEK